MRRIFRFLGFRGPYTSRHELGGVVAPPGGPRVELGFRDGSVQQLDPGSADAQALEEIAVMLTRRD